MSHTHTTRHVRLPRAPQAGRLPLHLVLHVQLLRGSCTFMTLRTAAAAAAAAAISKHQLVQQVMPLAI